MTSRHLVNLMWFIQVNTRGMLLPFSFIRSTSVLFPTTLTILTSSGFSAAKESILDEYIRGCLAILIDRRMMAQDVIDQLVYLFVLRGIPEHIRSDNGPEFTAREVRS